MVWHFIFYMWDADFFRCENVTILFVFGGVMRRFIYLFYFILPLIFLGCKPTDNDQDVNSNTQNPVEIKDVVTAQNLFSQVLINDERQIISVKNAVQDTNNLSITLESVVAKSDDCPQPIVNSKDLTFEIDRRFVSTCYYQYTVKDHPHDASLSVTATADSYVMVSATTNPALLTPISATATENETIAITIPKVDGFSLDSNSVVLGDGVAIVEPTSSKILYTAEVKGVSRILYSLTSDDGQGALAGYIDVAVSGDGNSLPIAENIAGPEDLLVDTPIVIDVSDAISDPDGDNLQLTDVYAFNADVHVLDSDDLNNKSFVFSAPEPGSYDVSFYITDHRGGWAVGLVHIMVKGRAKPWDDIILSDNELYTAPWEEQSADDYNIPYQLVEPEDILGNTYNITLFNYSVAYSLCQARGMVLPTVELLTKLYEERPDVNSSDSWPISENYWTRDDGNDGQYSFNLATGDSTMMPRNTPLIVTCINPGKLNVAVLEDNAFTSTDIPDASDKLVATVTGNNDEPVEGAYVYLYSKDNDVTVSSNSEKTDVNGNVSFSLSSESPGTFSTTVSFFSQQSENNITFINDSWGDDGDLVITPDPLELSVKDNIPMTAMLYSEAHPDGLDVTNSSSWSSSQPSIASVDGAGKVEGKAAGNSVISASYSIHGDERTAQVDASVSEIPYADFIYLDGVDPLGGLPFSEQTNTSISKVYSRGGICSGDYGTTIGASCGESVFELNDFKPIDYSSGLELVTATTLVPGPDHKGGFFLQCIKVGEQDFQYSDGRRYKVKCVK